MKQCSSCQKPKSKEWKQNNPEHVTQYGRDYNKSHKKQISEKNQKYQQTNKLQINKRVRLAKRNNIQFKLAANLRTRLWFALKKNQKYGSAVAGLGCSLIRLKEYLESKFQNGMTWNNYGEWHIDHIKPLSKFNLTNKKEFFEACHYTNLQPLWAKDNLKKSNK